MAAYERLLAKKRYEKYLKDHPNQMRLEDLFKFMEIKGKMGIFQSFNPRDFGADYDIVSVPKDNTPEADYWMIGSKYTDYQDEV